MSEDPVTPVLRLKPRLRVEGAPSAVDQLSPPENGHAELGSTAVAVAPPAALPSTGVSLKLRPRTSGAPEGAAPAPSAPPAAAPSSVALSPAAPVAPLPAAPVVPAALTLAPAVAAPAPSPAQLIPLSLAASPVAVPTPPAAPLNNPAVPAAVVTLPPPVAPSAPAPSAAPAGAPVDASRFKLKPRVVGPEAPPAVVPPGAISTKPLVAALPPLPSLPAVGPASPSPALTAVQALPKLVATVPPPLSGTIPVNSVATNLAPNLSTARLTAPIGEAPERPENTRAFKAGIWAVTTLVVLVVGGGAIFAYRFLQSKEVPPATTVHIAKPADSPSKPSPVPTPTAESPDVAAQQPVVASPQSLPGRMVGKARDVVAARDQSGQVSGVGEILGDTPEVPATARATPPAPAATGATLDRNTPLDASAPPPESVIDKPAAPPPSIAFRTYVANLRVSGVFQGEPGRALLNGRTIRIGEVSDNTLGIRLSGLDYDRKILYFEDNAGSTMQRRY